MNKKTLLGLLMSSMVVIVLFVGSSFSTAVDQTEADGAAVYKANCMVCHGETGGGIPGAFPPLEKSDYLAKMTKEEAITIVLKGKTGELTVNGNKFNSVMAPLASLSDDDIAAVLNYVSTSFGNSTGIKYSADDVKKVRK